MRDDASELDVAIAAANAGAAVLRRYYGSIATGSMKGRSDPVTIADKESEAAIVDVILAAFPDDGLLAEEGSGDAVGGRRWIIDPLDGTVNFLKGIPFIAVSIALYDGDLPIVGVVLDPIRDELFTARRGAGAAVGDTPISVSSTTDASSAVVTTGFPYDHHLYADEYAAVLADVLRDATGIRRYGAAALDLAWVAMGRGDAFFELDLQPWDAAAGALLVMEAGGRVTNGFGDEFTPVRGSYVASNGLLHEWLLDAVGRRMPPNVPRPSTAP